MTAKEGGHTGIVCAMTMCRGYLASAGVDMTIKVSLRLPRTSRALALWRRCHLPSRNYDEVHAHGPPVIDKPGVDGSKPWGHRDALQAAARVALASEDVYTT
jgi:hypothetical protein